MGSDQQPLQAHPLYPEEGASSIIQQEVSEDKSHDKNSREEEKRQGMTHGITRPSKRPPCEAWEGAGNECVEDWKGREDGKTSHCERQHPTLGIIASTMRCVSQGLLAGRTGRFPRFGG